MLRDDIQLGHDVETGVPVSLGAMERRQGVYVIGKTGQGKSTLFESMIAQDMEAGIGLCVLDPHGDLIDAALSRVPGRRERDVIVLDLADSDYPFGLNLFECNDLRDPTLVGRVAAEAVEVFEKLWGEVSWGPQLAQVLRNCAYTLIENQGNTLTEVRRLLLDRQFRQSLLRNVRNPQVREFWELEYEPLKPADQLNLVRSTLNKVDEWLVPAVYPIVGFGRTTVDFRGVMDQGRILLIRLARGLVGEGPVSLLGSAIVGQILNAALSRQDIAPADRRQFSLYADEFERFATPSFAQLLSEARKYGIATHIAHQHRSQLKDSVTRGAALNAANLIVFRVDGDDAGELAKQFDRTPPPQRVSGLKPKMAVSQDTVGHLAGPAGHSVPKIQEIARTLIKPLADLRNVIQDSDPPYSTVEGGLYIPQTVRRGDASYPLNRRAMEVGIGSLNEYFAHVMANPDQQLTQQTGELIVDALINLRGYIGYAAETCSSGFDLSETRACLRQHLIQIRYGGSWWPSTRESLRRARVAAILKFDNELPRLCGLTYGADDSALFHAQAEVERIEKFSEALLQLAHELAEYPILIASGQWEPTYESSRTYSDVEGEIASKLVGLPTFHALCKLLYERRAVEHLVHTPEFELRDPAKPVTAAIIRIKERTRAEHCAPRQEVLAEIERRQHSDGDGPTTRWTKLPE